jgi:AcrR family transcriptional regulator
MQTRWGDRQARRADILRAGRSLLGEQGLPALQMREVAHRAGIALGTVYTYFPTKESLYAAMYAERLDEMLGELAPALTKPADLERLFVLVATHYRDVYAEFGKELNVFAVARSGSDAAVNGELAAAAGRMWDAMRAIVQDISAADPDLVLTMLWSTMTGLADHFAGARHEMHPYSWDDAVWFAARTLTRGLVHEEQRR